MESFYYDIPVRQRSNNVLPLVSFRNNFYCYGISIVILVHARQG